MPPHSKSSKTSTGNREDAGVHDQEDSSETSERKEKNAVGSFLRGLARRAEADASLAVHIQSALEESGLLESAGSLESPGSLEPRRPSGRKTDKPGGRPGRPGSKKESNKPAAPVDPFQIFREQGVVALRETLEKIDLEELHAIVRKYRLDPGRISSRWTRNERVIDLIVDQVTAYARHGQAFSRL